ncbi:hypothetical protein ACFVXE_32310 [Streptomyces sp. NPDC058231]|uniref:hypothetical protein n=1 Tax=Streptomyces sp. NPDC058231 TaxID=3346392 RepID=UPI0036EB0EFB
MSTTPGTGLGSMIHTWRDRLPWPLRLLDGDFPDRDLMMGIAEHNLQEALAFLPSDDR